MGAVASVRVKCSGFTSQPNNKASDDVLNCSRNHHSREKSIENCSFCIETIIQVHEFSSDRRAEMEKKESNGFVWGEMVAFSRDNYFRWSDGEAARRLTCVSWLVLVLFWSFRGHFGVLRRRRSAYRVLEIPRWQLGTCGARKFRDVPLFIPRPF